MALNPSELPPKDKSWEAFYKRVKLVEFNNIIDHSKEFPFEDRQLLKSAFFLLVLLFLKISYLLIVLF